jgi:dCMP deaminase
MTTCLIAYVPVLHEGYIRLFQRYPDTLYLVGPDMVKEALPRLGRDLRQMSVPDMQKAIEGLGIFKEVLMFDSATAEILQQRECTVVMPTDEVSSALAKEFFEGRDVVYESIFLRWDKPITLAEQAVSPDRTITTEERDRIFMDTAHSEASKSGDWWRQVGAVAVRDTTVLFSGFNKHHPSEHSVYAFGNPRDNFDAGEYLEVSDTIHGEASIVAQAARAGESLLGTSMYVTTFPCINCARLLAEAGVSHVYYKDGYSRLDAEAVLKDHGIEIIQVKDVDTPEMSV